MNPAQRQRWLSLGGLGGLGTVGVDGLVQGDILTRNRASGQTRRNIGNGLALGPPMGR